MTVTPHLSLLLPKEAARRLGLSPSTLAKMRVRGDGPPFVKLGRSVRYDPSDLETYASSQRRRSTSETI